MGRRVDGGKRVVLDYIFIYLIFVSAILLIKPQSLGLYYIEFVWREWPPGVIFIFAGAVFGD